MDKFRNLKVGTKIITGYLLVLLLLTAVGGLAVIRLNQINQTVNTLAFDLAQDQHLADQMVSKILLMRYYAITYAMNQNAEDLTRYNEEHNAFQELLTQADTDITKPERVTLLNDIKADLTTYIDKFDQVEIAMNNRQQIVDNVLDVQGPLVENQLQDLRVSATNNNESDIAFYAGSAQRTFILMRLDAFKYLDNGDEAMATKFEERYDQTIDALDSLTPLVQDGIHQAELASIRTAVNSYHTGFQNLQNDYKNQNLLLADIQTLGPQIRQTASDMSTSVVNDFQTLATDTENLVQQTQFVLIVTVGIAVLATIALAVFISRSITVPLQSVAEVATAITNGDLSTRARVAYQDEVGLLANAFNSMTDNLKQRLEKEQQLRQVEQEANKNAVAKETIENTVNQYSRFIEQVTQGDLTVRLTLNGNNDDLTRLGHNLNNMVLRLGEMTTRIREATNNMATAANEILAAMTQQASGAAEQSAAISQTTTTIDEVRSIVEQALTRAEQVAEQSAQTTQISHLGQDAVTQTVGNMNQIKHRVAGIAENILALSEQTQRIGDIIATVNDIASQSNLLALNASVEAARAGEHGKGFNVVAVEVRNLAEQSKQATGQVKAILNEIQRATNAAVMATEEGTKGVDDGVKQTEQTGETIEQLAQSIVSNANSARQIVASSQQQTTGMEQIALAMQNINQATVQSLASTRQTEKAAKDLSTIAREMESLVAQYKLN
ncbi:MAG TPA: methyl-accepting chemotaxis protein [Anaerolineae bacterium]|nr:methyl-accepting chemotaxis protein [Anaerolineae bacterium]